MTHFQIWGIILAFVLVFTFFYGCYLMVKLMIKNQGSRPLPLPIQRYRRQTPTIEKQYGRDLFHASIKMYKYTANGPSPYDSKITRAVRDAEILLSEVNEKCFEIDREKHEEKEKRTDEFIKDLIK